MLVQGETRTPRHSEVEQQEEGRRSTIAAIRNRRAEAAAKDVTCRRPKRAKNWLSASVEPHLRGPDAQGAKGDGAMGRAHKEAAKARRVIGMQGERPGPALALASAT